MVVTCAPLTCAIGTRQLFTSSPFISTEQEPHSPSPQPSFAPVSPNSIRRTSKSLSIGSARTLIVSSLRRKEISSFLGLGVEELMRFAARSWLERRLRASMESSRIEFLLLLRPHSGSPARVRPSAVHQYPSHRRRHVYFPSLRKTRGSKANRPMSA